jgi:hypothetical protein
VGIISLNDSICRVLRFPERPTVTLSRVAMFAGRFPHLNKKAVIVRCRHRFNRLIQMKALPVTHSNYLRFRYLPTYSIFSSNSPPFRASPATSCNLDLHKAHQRNTEFIWVLFSFSPWLYPGGRRAKEFLNRFNGLSSDSTETVETVQ